MVASNDEILTIAQAAARFAVSRATAYRHWEKWPHFYIGGQPRFRASELDEWFSAARPKPAAVSRRIVIAKTYERARRR